MTLNQLEYALSLKKHKSFKKASDRLNISQPALSIQIQNLEEEIELLIFNRSTKPVSVTSDGALFLEKAEKIITSTHQLQRFSEELNTDYRGLLRIGIIPTLAPYLVPLFSGNLQKDFPGFRLDIHEIITEEVVNRVRAGELDAGIISTPVSAYGIKSIPLFYERFYIYSSESSFEKQSELSLNDIRYDRLWLLEEGNCFRDQINDFCNLNNIRKDKPFIYRSNSIDALIRIVDNNGGMTILPELSTLSLNIEQELHIKNISGKPKAREIGLIVTPNFDKKRYIDKICEYITENIPKHMLNRDNCDVVDPNVKM